MNACQFLLELLCEEIPANALPGMREQLRDGFATRLSEVEPSGVEVRVVSTVRRLTVHVAGLPERQLDREEEVTGPPVKAAFAADGSPTPAATGFARGQGIHVEALRIVKGPKGEVVAATRLVRGRATAEILADIVREVVPALHVPKAMRWGEGEYPFVRPLHRIVAMFGAWHLDQVVAVELFGVASGSVTVGHRVVAPQEIDLSGIAGFADYCSRLAAAGVIVDHDERAAMIREKAAALAAVAQATVRADDQLLAEWVELVEYPGVLCGEVEARFLALPEEILVTTLKHHQKCLVLERDGAVAPRFLAVCDRPDDPEGLIRRGASWVAGARLADASFFFAQDRRRKLAEFVAGLVRVVFHQKLGSFEQKAACVARLAVALADHAELDVERGALTRAAGLAKADLTTAMVGEFAELQGVIGGIYAREDGEEQAVWQALYDQYRPAGLDGEIPRGLVGALIGLADRLDTLAGMFAVGEVPSGSKDPFALRRAALAVVRICAEFPLPVDLADAVRTAVGGRRDWLAGDSAATVAALQAFLAERERFALVSSVGLRPDVVDAVLQAHWGVVPDDIARARALDAVRDEAMFGPLSLAFKRVRNLLAKAGQGAAAPDLLVEPAEQALAVRLAGVEGAAQIFLAEGDHEGALRALSALAEPLDRFFVDVLVLCEDEPRRDARLALLARIEQLFLRLADISRLAADAR